MLRHAAFAAFMLVCGAAFAQSDAASSARPSVEPATQPVAVMELFTSQGCSSCPPADALLAAHAGRDDILALAWHVDYWDYLGWRDTLARPAHAERQRAYAKRLGEGVYTPQLVVNGVIQGIGHRRDEVAEMLDAAKRGAAFVPLAVRRNGSGFHVSLSAGGASLARVEDATLFLVWFDPTRVVPIERGENAGRRMVYRNTVRGMQMLGSVAQGRLEVSLSLSAMRRAMPSGLACALILQQTVNGLPGPILAAAKLGDLPAR